MARNLELPGKNCSPINGHDPLPKLASLMNVQYH